MTGLLQVKQVEDSEVGNMSTSVWSDNGEDCPLCHSPAEALTALSLDTRHGQRSEDTANKRMCL